MHIHLVGDIRYFGSTNYHRSDTTFSFLAINGSAQTGKFKGMQVSTSYSGTIPDEGILFGTDTNLYRASANYLKTDDTLEVGGDLYVTNDTAYIYTWRH